MNPWSRNAACWDWRSAQRSKPAQRTSSGPRSERRFSTSFVGPRLPTSLASPARRAPRGPGSLVALHAVSQGKPGLGDRLHQPEQGPRLRAWLIHRVPSWRSRMWRYVVSQNRLSRRSFLTVWGAGAGAAVASRGWAFNFLEPVTVETRCAPIPIAAGSASTAIICLRLDVYLHLRAQRHAQLHPARVRAQRHGDPHRPHLWLWQGGR